MQICQSGHDDDSFTVRVPGKELSYLTKRQVARRFIVHYICRLSTECFDHHV
jgi:hypothetical protein